MECCCSGPEAQRREEGKRERRDEELAEAVERHVEVELQIHRVLCMTYGPTTAYVEPANGSGSGREGNEGRDLERGHISIRISITLPQHDAARVFGWSAVVMVCDRVRGWIGRQDSDAAEEIPNTQDKKGGGRSSKMGKTRKETRVKITAIACKNYRAGPSGLHRNPPSGNVSP